MNIITSNRAFLANPSESREKQTQVYRKNHITLLKSLQDKADIFTFEQEEAIDSVTSDSKKHLEFLDKIYAFYTSGNWRRDQLLLSNELQPLIKNISARLTNITNQQNQNTQSLSQQLLKKIDTAIFITIAALFSAIVIGIAVA